MLGTFWRDTASEQEEIEYFATGHALVEALFGFLRDGPYGRNGGRFIERKGPMKARGLEVLFHVQPPEPEDTSPGARVPSRQLARFLDRMLLRVAVVHGADGKPQPDTSVLRALEEEGRSLRGDELLSAFPGLPSFVDGAMKVASGSAQAELDAMLARARSAIERERDATVGRLSLSLEHQAVLSETRERVLAGEREHYGQLLQALSGVKLTLDSACAFVINR